MAPAGSRQRQRRAARSSCFAGHGSERRLQPNQACSFRRDAWGDGGCVVFDADLSLQAAQIKVGCLARSLRLRSTFVTAKSASALPLDKCRPGSSDREEGEPREASDMRSPAPCPRLSPDRSGAPDCALFRGREFEKPSGAGRRPRRLPPARREQQSCRPLAPSIIGTSILIWSSAPHGESS